MALAEGQQWLPMEGGRAQKLHRMGYVVRDNSQQRITWGGSGGVEERERTADKSCFCSVDRLGLQTAAD